MLSVFHKHFENQFLKIALYSVKIFRQTILNSIFKNPIFH